MKIFTYYLHNNTYGSTYVVLPCLCRMSELGLAASTAIPTGPALGFHHPCPPAPRIVTVVPCLFIHMDGSLMEC